MKLEYYWMKLLRIKKSLTDKISNRKVDEFYDFLNPKELLVVNF